MRAEYKQQMAAWRSTWPARSIQQLLAGWSYEFALHACSWLVFGALLVLFLDRIVRYPGVTAFLSSHPQMHAMLQAHGLFCNELPLRSLPFDSITKYRLLRTSFLLALAACFVCTLH